MARPTAQPANSDTNSDRGSTDRNTTADQTITILTLFSDSQPVLTAAEIAERCGLSRSSTYRYLQSLRSAGFLEPTGSNGRFRLGPEILRLARIARQSHGLADLARPEMERVAEATGEVVLLTRRSGNQVVCLERIESTHPIRISFEQGHALPIHAGAQGKCQLAFETPDEIDRVLASAELRRFTPATTVSPDEIRTQLEVIRADGHAIVRGEVDPGVVGVAAPVFERGGSVAAALGIAAPEFRLDDSESLEHACRVVVAAARELSQRLAEVG